MISESTKGSTIDTVGSTQTLIGGHGPDVVEKTNSTPIPGPGQVLIRVRAAALNRVDLYMLEGSYDNSAQGTGILAAGREGAGTIVAVDEGGEESFNGTLVMSTASWSFSDYLLVDSRHVMPVPAGLSWAEASSPPVALGTEHDAMVHKGFGSGSLMLVLGAIYSVGLIGVQLAQAMGVSTVIATTTSDEKAAALKCVGADVVVNSNSDTMAEIILVLTDDNGVDAVLDYRAGQPLTAVLPATAIGGTIINIGHLAGSNSTIILDSLTFRRLTIGTTSSVRTSDQRALVYERLRDGDLDAISDGRVRPIVDQVVPFSQAKTAADILCAGGEIGKVVLDVTRRAGDVPANR